MDPESDAPQQVEEAPEPVIDEPFTQADSLELQRYQQGLAGARKALYDGDIDQNTHDQLAGELVARINPLTVKAQRAQQAMAGARAQQAMHQNAQVQTMAHQDQVYRARGFQDRVATYVDPMTGQAAHMYEQKPGHWGQIEFPEQQQQDGGDEPVEMPRGDPDQTFEDAPRRGGLPADRALPEIRENGRAQQGPQKDDWLPTGGFRPTPAQEQIQRAKAQGGTVSADVHDQAVRDRQAQLNGRARDTALSSAQVNEIVRRANQAVRMPPGPIRDRLVSDLSSHLIMSHERQQQHQEDMESRAQEHRLQEQARGELAAGKTGGRGASADAKMKQDTENIRHHMQVIESEAHNFQTRIDKAADRPTVQQQIRGEMPDYLQTYETKLAEAKRRKDLVDQTLAPPAAGTAQQQPAPAAAPAAKPVQIPGAAPGAAPLHTTIAQGLKEEKTAAQQLAARDEGEVKKAGGWDAYSAGYKKAFGHTPEHDPEDTQRMRLRYFTQHGKHRAD